MAYISGWNSRGRGAARAAPTLGCEVEHLSHSFFFGLFLFFAILLAAQSIASLVDGYRFVHFVRSRLRSTPGPYSPPAAVIIPCKEIVPGFELNISSFLAQDYPNYQVVFVVASENDPAHGRLAERLKRAASSESRSSPRTRLVVAGYSDARGEKVNNLLAGVSAVESQVEVLVFADSDVHPKRDWLRWLVAPLAESGVTVSTGFRWYLPGAGFASQFRAAWDTSIATLFGDHKHNFAWGGSMAMRATDFKRLGVADRYWTQTVSDDYAVTRAVRDAGGRIRFEPRSLVPSLEESSFREFFRWANRQIILTRVYARRLWALGLAANSIYVGTFLAGFALLTFAEGSTAARVGVAIVLGVFVYLGMAKGMLRSDVALELFPEEKEWLAEYQASYWRLAPLVPWVMWLNFLIAGFARRIEWSGTSYELCSRTEMKVVRRNNA